MRAGCLHHIHERLLELVADRGGKRGLRGGIGDARREQMHVGVQGTITGDGDAEAVTFGEHYREDVDAIGGAERAGNGALERDRGGHRVIVAIGGDLE